jgi:hypothetical protein
VAHRFNIPAEFQFRPPAGKWRKVTCRALGWWRDNSDEVDYTHVEVAFESESGAASIRADINDLPRETALYLFENADSGLDFTQLSEMLVFHRITESSVRYADAWLMRKEFFSLVEVHDQILAFLNKWGRWDLRDFLFPRRILLEQKRFRRIINAPTGFKQLRLPFTSTAREEFPLFNVVVSDCRSAIETSLLIDFLQGTTFGICDRPDCGTPYEITSKHKRRYCGWYCAHLESTRRQRRERAGSRKSKARRRSR